MLPFRLVACLLAPLLAGCHAVIGFDDELDFGGELDDLLTLGTCTPITLKGVVGPDGVPTDDDFGNRGASENAWRLENGVTGSVVSWCDAGKLMIEPHFEMQWWMKRWRSRAGSSSRSAVST